MDLIQLFYFIVIYVYCNTCMVHVCVRIYIYIHSTRTKYFVRVLFTFCDTHPFFMNFLHRSTKYRLQQRKLQWAV